MFYIVESDVQIKLLESFKNIPTFMDIISTHDLHHPKLTSTVAVYLRPLGREKGYIIPIAHDECINIGKDRVHEVLKQFETLYTLDRKASLYHFNLRNTVDLSLMYSMKYYKKLEVPRSVSTYSWFYTKFADKANINQLLPISKILENSENVYNSVEKHMIELKPQSGFEFYNNLATNIFFLIEQNGISLEKENFREKYSLDNPQYSINKGKILTSYNLYNSTSRPTNSFNSINFSALPKKGGFRECYIPSNDSFIELDFDGYHIRLLCEQIGYELTGESAHKQIAKTYFNKEELTEEEYDLAKQINFQALYGKIPSELANVRIFKLIQEYIDTLWKTYIEKGEIIAPISEKPFTSELKDMNPQKLMNYVMQSLETSNNIVVLKEVLKYLQNKKTKIALYIYDAIVFDYSEEDGEDTIEDLKKIMETNGKYPVKGKTSTNLVL